jgi:hypothetical protein
MACQKRFTFECPQVKRMNECRRAGLAVDEALQKWSCDSTYEKTCKAFKATPPRMTSEEFIIEQNNVLKEIPKEFKDRLSYMAYERGHSAGYEEIISILKGLVNNLKQPIADFQKRISMEIHNAMIDTCK